MSKVNRILSILLSVLLSLGVFAGCSGDKKADGAGNSNASSADANTLNNGDTGGGAKIANGDVTLKYWLAMNPNITATAKDCSELPMFREMEKQTGVKIEFIHPSQGTAAQQLEQFNIMIASNDLPDMIQWNWNLDFQGGPTKAAQDGIILDLTDKIASGAPNLTALFEKYPIIEKQVKSDEGKIYVFPYVKDNDSTLVWAGPIMRKDWLDDLGLALPETMDDWTNILTAFKNEKGATAPLTFMDSSLDWSPCFYGAYGISRTFYVDVDDGKAKYGPYQAAYKDVLTALKKWFDDGLLDPDFATQNATAQDAKITSGQSGAFVTSVGGGMGRYLTTMETENPKFDLVGVTPPVLKKGEQSKYGHRDYQYPGSGSVAITTQCENVDVAVKWLDYCYSEKGQLIFNYGVENESYVMADGKPQFTELVTKNPDGLPLVSVLARYSNIPGLGPYMPIEDAANAMYPYQQQIEAKNAWNKVKSSGAFPPVSLTTEESQKLGTIMNEVKTYVDEMYLKFVMGQEPLSNFDQYIQTLKGMDIEEAIQIQQAALDRYNKR